MTTAPTPSDAELLARGLEEGFCGHAAWLQPAAAELRRLQAENERLQGSLEAQRLISDRAIALAKELEARRPLPLSDDERLRLRSDVARAIWDVMRDCEPMHQVWDCADAAIKAVHGITGGSS